MQSTDSIYLENYCKRFELEIQSYNGNESLDVWWRYIDGVPGKDGATQHNLALRCINKFIEKKEFRNDWSFIKICLLIVLRSKDKLSTLEYLHNLGVGREEGLFYKKWAEINESAGRMEEAKAIYEKGLELSKNNAKELRIFYVRYLEKHPFKQNSMNGHHGDVRSVKLHEVSESNKHLSNSVEESQVVMNSEDYSIEELMASYWRDGKCRSQKCEVETQLMAADPKEIRRKSAFGSVSIMGNITEESESYHTNNSTFSPLRTSIFKDVSLLRKEDIDVSIKLPIQSDGWTSFVDDRMDVIDGDEDDEEEEEETVHGKIAEEFLVRCFYRPSDCTPRKSEIFPTPKVTVQKKDSFSIYEDPQPTKNRNFTIFEDPRVTSFEEKSQKSPKLKVREEVNMKMMERENIPPERSQHKGFHVHSNDKVGFNAPEISFLDTSVHVPQHQMDKSILDFQGFFEGLQPGRTSTQNVTAVFKNMVKSNAPVHVQKYVDESLDQSKEKLRRCLEEDTMMEISRDDTHIRKNLASCFGVDIGDFNHSAVENSILADNVDKFIDDIRTKNAVTREPTKADIYVAADDDDNVFNNDPSFMDNHEPLEIGETVINMQDFYKGLKPGRTSTQNVTELFRRRESTIADFPTTYEAPLNDQGSPEARRRERKSKSHWRRCSTAGIAPQPVNKRLQAIMDDNDDDQFDLSSEGEVRLMNITGKLEYVPPALTTSFANMSVIIDTENPYNEETIKSFISRLKPPLNNYAGFHEVRHVKMPVFRTGSGITLGINKFLIKKILGEGAFAKAYHLSYLGHDKQYRDCVAKIQRPPCPLEFYITRELHKRVAEIVREERFIDVTPSLMQITEAYVFEDGSLFLNEKHDYGTLLDLINLDKSKNIELPQWFVLMLCYELVCVVDAMHRCSIIHGDLKPDNVLIRQLPLLKEGESISSILKSRTTFLKIIDFGQSIDMGIYPPGTEFTAKSKKKDLQCIEMKIGKSWSYHIDLYFLAGLMYVLMMGNYMYPELVGNRWSARIKLKRSWEHADTIKHFFDMLINVRSPNDMPKLHLISDWLLTAIDVDTKNYNAFIGHLTSIINAKK